MQSGASASTSFQARQSGLRAIQLAAQDGWAVMFATAVLWGMVGYMLVGDRPFRPDLLAASDISPINRYAWLLLSALSVPVLWLRRGDLWGLARAIWPIVLLYGWFAITTVWALDQAASVRRMLQTGLALICCIAVVLGLRRAARLHWLVCIMPLLIVAVDLASWPVVPGIAMSPIGLQGMHGQKNQLGMYAMYAILAAVTCALNPVGRLRRWFLLGGAAIATLALLASRSGTSIALTLAACLILPGLVVLLRRRGLVVGAVLGAGAAGAVAALALYLMWCGVAGADPLAPLAGVTFTRRTDLWVFLLQNIRQRPWGGAGFASFWAIDKTVQPSLHSGLWFGRGVNIAPEGHSAYLDLAATTGWIGFALGLFVLGRAVWQAGRAVHASTSHPTMPLATAAFHLGFCIMMAGHSVTESTLFAANSQLGTLFVLSVVSVEWARVQAVRATGSARGATAARPGPARRPTGHRPAAYG